MNQISRFKDFDTTVTGSDFSTILSDIEMRLDILQL